MNDHTVKRDKGPFHSPDCAELARRPEVAPDESAYVRRSVTQSPWESG